MRASDYVRPSENFAKSMMISMGFVWLFFLLFTLCLVILAPRPSQAETLSEPFIMKLSLQEVRKDKQNADFVQFKALPKDACLYLLRQYSLDQKAYSASNPIERNRQYRQCRAEQILNYSLWNRKEQTASLQNLSFAQNKER
jgi:hypothetical protein